MPLRNPVPQHADFKALNAIIEQEQDYTIRRYQCALWYMKVGIHVVPFRQGKYAGYPKGITANTLPTLKKIDQWWHPETGKHLNCDIAAAMGGGSGLCAIDLDVDEEEGKNGIDTLAELMGSVGRWEDKEPTIKTWVQVTPRGGRHLVYRYHPQVGISATQAGARFDDIDTRGAAKENITKNGGVIFVAPTIKLDKHGEVVGTYEWQTDCLETEDVPQWLVDCLLGIPANKLIMPESFDQGSRDATVHKYFMSCAGAGYSEEELSSLVPDILSRMIPPDPSLVDKCLKSVLKSNVFANAKKEKVVKQLIGGLDLKRNKKGIIFKTQDNLDIILRSGFFDAEMKIYYDAFLDAFTIGGNSDETGRDIAMPVKLWLSRYFGFELSADLVRATIVETCKFNSARPHTNALRDYILQCNISTGFDAIEALGDLMGFKGKKLEPVYRRYLKLWLCGAVARGLEPGHKFDYTLILIGAQGIGKSMLLHELVPNTEWFCDSLTSDVAKGNGNKDELLKLGGSWIMEMAELTPLKGAAGKSGEALKGFLTAQVDKYRAPYERATSDHKRTCVFAGTSNTDELYRDASGSRRYLTINLGNHQIDWSLVAPLRDMIWAQARDIYNEVGGDALWLSQEESKVQAKVNERSYRQTVLGSAILEWAIERTRFKTGDIIAAGSSSGLIGEYKPHEIEREAKEVLKHKGFVLKKQSYKTSQGDRKGGVYCWSNPDHPYEKLSDQEKREGAAMPYHGYDPQDKEEY